MTFEEAIRILKENIHQLPGEEAQFKMAPVSRLQKQNYLANNSTPKKSAVCVLIYPKNSLAYITLIKRQPYDGAHSAQISFPGGKVDEHDVSFERAALRELKEEIGVELTEADIIGRLTDLYIPVSEFIVQPVLAFCSEQPLFTKSDREVAEIIEWPLQELLNEENVKKRPITLSTSITVNTPYFEVDGKVVWGATAMILSELKQMLLGVG